MPQHFYNEEEAEQILRLATRQAITGGMSREDLLRTAAEVGVSESQVLAAEAQFRETQSKDALEQRFWERQKAKFITEILGGIGTNGTCIAIWWLTGHDYFWPGWILFATLVGLWDDVEKRLVRPSAKYRKAFAKWQESGAQDLPLEADEEQESGRRGRVVIGARVGKRSGE